MAAKKKDTPEGEEPKKTTRRKKHTFTDEELESPRSPEQFRLALRRSCRSYYDVQQLRLQMLGRLTKKAPEATIELHPVDLKRLQERLVDLETAEKNMLKDLERQLATVPFYQQVILPQRATKYRGLGPRMASVIVSSFDIEREDTVSKMWAFAGLRPIPCKRCFFCFVQLNETEDGMLKHGSPPGSTCRFKGETLDPEGTDLIDSAKAQRPIPGQKLNYNAWLRSKLCGVLGEVMLKVGSPYRKFYDGYKLRWQQANKGTSDAHRHKAAIRYMIKCLLTDIWREWRTFEGLSVRPPYAEEYLGKKHGDGGPFVPNNFDPVQDEIAAELAALEGN